MRWVLELRPASPGVRRAARIWRSGTRSSFRSETSRRGRQDFRRSMARRPRRSQPVAEPSWNDLKVEMKHVLPSGGSVRLNEIQPVRTEALVDEVGDPFRHRHDGSDVALGDLPDVRGMGPRNHQSVAFGGLSPIEERHGQIILGDHVGGSVTRDDPAEDAVGCHTDSLHRHPYRPPSRRSGARHSGSRPTSTSTRRHASTTSRESRSASMSTSGGSASPSVGRGV